MHQPVFWFQECSLPAELYDKHQTLEGFIEILIMTLSNIFPGPRKDLQAGKPGKVEPFNSSIYSFISSPSLSQQLTRVQCIWVKAAAEPGKAIWH